VWNWCGIRNYSIAIDARIKKVARELGVTTSSHPQAECFFLSAAREAGLNGWELDRLLYNFTGEVLAALSGKEARRAPAARKGRPATCGRDAV